ncbi:ABC transporter ATP-binding protein [Methanocalculus sp.]|uniref:ABC transporter ATP-binding protein n=1 Tax=Methanocalculus sp. TaxID=2004547 RepID=UPI002626A2CC|nr:ABC transporter ATP-binding protein [Methanocalculus sp.]MDG6249590.1 ABC transporter ATP-binding protein [Methanocalculus sp.]
MSVIRNAVHILYYLFGPFKKMLALYLLAVIALAGLEVFRVSLVYPIINYGLDVENQHRLLDTFFDLILPASMHPFLASALLLLLTTAFIAGFYGIVAYSGAYVFATVRVSLDRQIFYRLMGNDYSYFAAKKQGDLLYIGQGAVNEAAGAIGAFMEFIKNSLMALLYFLFIVYLSVWLAVALIILGFVYALIIRQQLFTRIYRNSSILNKAYMEKSVAYQEFISGIKTIFITGSIPFWKVKYDVAVLKLKQAYTFVGALGKLPSIINDFIMFSVIALGAVVLYVSTEGDFLSYIGLFGTFMLALYRLVPTATQAQTNLTAMVQTLPALELVYGELISQESEKEKKKAKIDGKPFIFEDTIAFQGVTFHYPGASNNIICDLSFEVPKNTSVAIVGDSGSGKTTIANLLALLYNPDCGVISFDGVDVTEFDTTSYLRSLGYIGQETFIYNDSIKENIRFGLDCTDEEIIEAARRADAHSFIMATDHGYDTIIGDQGMKLSGGQRQRVAIARIILRNPEILLLDEATSSLDNISEKKIIDSINKLSEQMTVITIAHRLTTIQNADVIYVLRKGRIIERGTHEVLLELKGEYYQLYLGQDKEDRGDNVMSELVEEDRSA